MVEMNETANIVNNASHRSLVILDESRGTSTFDGLSIAWSVAEFSTTKNQPAGRFSTTHYHELTSSAADAKAWRLQLRVAMSRYFL